jgi:hypothetical protein
MNTKNVIKTEIITGVGGCISGGGGKGREGGGGR